MVEKDAALWENLVKCVESPRRQISLAAAEAVGKRLAANPTDNLLSGFLSVFMRKEGRDLAALVGILERATSSYPKLLD